MATLRLIGFSGEVPRLLPRLLGDSFAQAAYNTRLDDGGLTPVREPRLITRMAEGDFPNGIDTIYLHGNEWLGWPGLVHAVPGPVADDRLYIFGDGKPRVRVNGNEYDLGIAPPSAPLAATLNGSPTSDLMSTRLYVYTKVTDMGEETEPSPVSNEVNWEPGQTVELTGFEDTAPNRTITHQRIYRSATGTSGGADFYLIAERPASTSNFVDSVSPEDFMERLPSRRWNAPPDDLHGVIPLPNGMMVGASGKDLYFSEPWRPHAWPEAYVLTCDYEIVGLGAYANTIVVATKGNPYIVSGNMPDTMVMEKLELNLPCINPRGIQDLGYSVIYPSNEGLVVVSSGTAQITTTSLLSREEWQAMSPMTMVSGKYNSRYFASYRFFDSRLDEHAGTMIFDFTGEQPFIIRSDQNPDAYHYDITSGKLYFAVGRDIYEHDAQGQINALQYWKSKEFVLPKPTNFGAIYLEVDASISEDELDAIEQEQQAVESENLAMMNLPSIGGEINGSGISCLPMNGDFLKRVPELNRTVAVQVYADGVLVASINRYGNMCRLPSGFLARRWEISVSSDMPITQITLATTGAELMAV